MAFVFITTSALAVSSNNWIITAVEPAVKSRARPAIYESKVAWVERLSPTGFQEIVNVSEATLWNIPEFYIPAFSSTSLLRSELDGFNFTILVYDLASGQIWDLKDELPPCAYKLIDMYGDWVITHQNCVLEKDTIHGFNLQTNEYLTIAPYEDDLIGHELPTIDQNYVLWVDVDCCSSDIRMFDLDTRTTISVTNDGGYKTFPDKSGDWVVWSGGSSSDIFALNLLTTEQITITNDSAMQWYPRIDGDFVVWTDQRNDYGDIYGYNLTTRQQFPVATGDSTQINQAIHGSLVTWTEYRDETFYIHGFDMSTGEYSVIHEHPPETNIMEPSMVYGDRVVWRYELDLETYLYTAQRLQFQSYLPVLIR